MQNMQMQNTQNNPESDKEKEKTNQSDHSEKINLSFLLNLLDGILETPGRILIITTNDPDKLDKALVRPGRIDIKIEVGYCDKPMIEEMFNYFYEIDQDFGKFVYNENITPAEMNKVLLDNFNSSEKAMKKLLEICSD